MAEHLPLGIEALPLRISIELEKRCGADAASHCDGRADQEIAAVPSCAPQCDVMHCRIAKVRRVPMSPSSAIAMQEPAVSDRGAPRKDFYDRGEIPPLGHVPARMYAWAIRRERHGPPDAAMQVEVVPTWELDSHDVLVLVMAAGVNYNGIWAALGT